MLEIKYRKQGSLGCSPLKYGQRCQNLMKSLLSQNDTIYKFGQKQSLGYRKGAVAFLIINWGISCAKVTLRPSKSKYLHLLYQQVYAWQHGSTATGSVMCECVCVWEFFKGHHRFITTCILVRHSYYKELTQIPNIRRKCRQQGSGIWTYIVCVLMYGIQSSLYTQPRV